MGCSVMWLFLAGAALFFGAHLLPSYVGMHQALVQRLGALPYQGLFSLVSAAGLVLIVLGYREWEPSSYWATPNWGYPANSVLMLCAAILMAAAYVPGNLKRWFRHPMLLAVLLWSLAHLLVTGHDAGLALFGLFALYALFGMWSANRRGAVYQSQARPWWSDLLVLLIGVLAYVLLIQVHAWLGRPIPSLF
jgi:uncharacterized membrane protein